MNPYVSSSPFFPVFSDFCPLLQLPHSLHLSNPLRKLAFYHDFSGLYQGKKLSSSGKKCFQLPALEYYGSFFPRHNRLFPSGIYYSIKMIRNVLGRANQVIYI